MYELKYLRFRFIAFFLLALTLVGCKKELKLADTKYDPNLALPVAHAALSLGDLVSDDNEHFSVDDDGMLRFYYRDDSLLTYNVKDFFELNSQIESKFIYRLGAILLYDFEPLETSATLADFLSVVDPVVSLQVQAMDATCNTMPAMVSTGSTEYGINDFQDFERIACSEGWMHVEVSNNLPVSFEHFYLKLYTVDPDGNYDMIENVVFHDMGPHETKIDSFSLEGITVYNDIRVYVNSFETLASSGAVSVNLEDGVDFRITTNSLKVVAARAKVPPQHLSTKQISTQISVDKEERITHAILKEASVEYSVSTFFDLDASFLIEFPTIEIDNQPAEFKVGIDDGSEGRLDLSGATLDLTANGAQPYNYLPINIRLEIDGSDTWVQFDTAMGIEFNYTIGDFYYQYLEGWVGQKELQIGPSELNLNFSELNNLSGSIWFTDPKFDFKIDNNIGLPLELAVEFESGTNEGSSKLLNVDPFRFPSPTTPGDVVSEIVSIDNSSSQLSDFLSILPDRLSIACLAVTNPDYASTGIVYNNYLISSGNVNLGLEFELPFQLSLRDVVFQDTVNFNINPDFLDNAIEGELSIVTNNRIPMEISLEIYMVDSVDFNVYDTFTIDILDPAPVDSAGVVTNAISMVSKIELNTNRFDQMKHANKMIFRALINTTSSQEREVIFYSDYDLEIKLGMLVDYSIELD